MFPLLVDQNASSNDGACGAIVVLAAPSETAESGRPPGWNMRSKRARPRTPKPAASSLVTTTMRRLLTSITGAATPPPTLPDPTGDPMQGTGGGSVVSIR